MKRLILILSVSLMASVFAGAVLAQSEGEIAGIVYEDLNGNGIREEGEEGVLDVEVTFLSGDWETTINTDGAGAFSIELNPATWTVSIAAPAGYDAPKSSVEVLLEEPGDSVTSVEFGLVPVLPDDAADDTTDDTTDGDVLDGSEDGDTTEDGKEVLPASGGIVPEGTLIGGLVGLFVIGAVLVVVGQRRSRRDG